MAPSLEENTVTPAFLKPASAPRVTLRQIWAELKEYFGDGYVAGSAPFRFSEHLCESERPPETDNIHYGISIDEDAMSLFGSLGQPAKPPCTCADMAELVRHIDAFVATAPDVDPAAYAVYSRKDEATAEESCVYAMRDTLQWWVHWHGTLDRRHHWKHVYVGFGTACDDVLIPPQHLADGTFRCLGHTVRECLAGLRGEGVPDADLRYMEMCVLRQYFAQYVEKVDPALRGLLVGRTHVMSQFRVVGANTHGCGAALLAARGVTFAGRENLALEMASYGDAMSMDLAKEALGLLRGEPTETTAGPDRRRLKAELRWTYARTMALLDTHPMGKYLRRYHSAGLHFVPFNDRYQERLEGRRRRPLTPAMARLIASYTVGPCIIRENL